MASDGRHHNHGPAERANKQYATTEVVVVRELTDIFQTNPELAHSIADIFFQSGRLGDYDFWVKIADNARLRQRA